MSLEMLGFASDITRSRLDLEENFLLLNRKESLKEIFKFLLKKHKEAPEKTPKLSSLRSKNVRFLVALFYSKLLDSLKSIFEKHSLEIYPVIIGSTEVIFQAANLNKENKSEVEDLLEKMERYFLIKEKYFDDKLDLYFPPNKEMSQEEEEKAFEKFEANVNFGLKPSDLNFDFWFAAALRQIPIQQIAEFISLHEAKFFSKEEYTEFIENIRLEFEHFFTEKTKKTLTRLLDKEDTTNPQVIEINTDIAIVNTPETKANEEASKEEETINGFSNLSFEVPPFEIEEFKLNAQPWQIRKFLTFLLNPFKRKVHSVSNEKYTKFCSVKPRIESN